MINRIVRRLALILALLLAIPAAALAGQPTDIVKSTVDEVLRLLSDPGLKSPDKKKQRRQMIKRAIDRHFDYDEMSKRSLGASWRNLTPAQRSEFVGLFADLLEASYAEKIERFSDEKVNYTGEILDGADYAEVRTTIIRKNDRIPMDYRLYKAEGSWKVYDVVIEGVSLVSNYRSQFSRIIREGSYGELVRRLRTKVNELQQLEKM
ncbi:MAG: ABC transporter substrate-binding protein [Deltaproteobacteria bacterium]|nr:ABC transporter substrate-binding protein [Deltaproteobacteria bacterium]